MQLENARARAEPAVAQDEFHRRQISCIIPSMCAHYTPPDAADIERFFALGRKSVLADYKTDAYPTDVTPFIALDRETGERTAGLGRFGLLPHWIKPAELKKAGRNTYNARTETVHEKPSFSTAWRQRNWCIIPAAAIFEPSYETGRPVPWRIFRSDGKPLAIAGIRWAWKNSDAGELLESFSMLTINADDHALMRRFHAPKDEKRMVVILSDDAHGAWLNATHDEARTFFFQFPANELDSEPAPLPPREKAA